MMFEWLPRPEKDNAIGLHDDGDSGDGPGTIGFMYSLVDWMVDQGFTWLKFLTDVNHKSGRLPIIEYARKKGLMPIVRPFRQPCHPRGLDLYDDYIKAVVGAGCPYIEVGNEPNLAAVECWKPYNEYKYNGTTGHAAFVNLLYDQWLRNADKIRRLGGIPLFPALSPTAYTSNEVYFHHLLYDDILGLGKLRDNLEWAFEGAGVAIHNRPGDGQPLDILDRCAFRDYENIERKFENALGRKIPLFGTEAGYEDGMVGDYIKHQFGNLYPNNQNYIDWHKTLNHDLYSRFNPDHEKPWHDYLICECAWLAADDGWYASGWARNSRVGGGALPSFMDMNQISNFTRAEGSPYDPPDPPPPDPPDPEPQPPSDEVEFVGLIDEMIERLTICGPEDPTQPYWKVYRVEIQPETNNMSAFAVLPPGTEVGIQFWNGGQYNFSPKADPYAPPGAKAWAASMPMFSAWGGYGVTVLDNSEAIHGFGLYGNNLELTHTAHHPTLIYFHRVEPDEPEPQDPLDVIMSLAEKALGAIPVPADWAYPEKANEYFQGKAIQVGGYGEVTIDEVIWGYQTFTRPEQDKYIVVYSKHGDWENTQVTEIIRD